MFPQATQASRPEAAASARFGWLQALGRRAAGRHVSQKQLLVITSQLAVMLASGCDLCNGLETMSRQNSHPYLREVLADLHQSVKHGLAFSQALARHPAVFSSLYVTMVRAGESSGLLKAMLQGLQAMVRNQIRVSSTIRSALMYPAVLISVALSAIVVMTTFVLPRFAAVFKASNAPLPGSTLFVLGASEFIARNALILLPSLAAFVVFLLWLICHPVLRPTTHAWALRLPLLGQTLRLSYTVRAIQALGLLSKSGMPLAESILLTRDMMGNYHYWEFFNHLHGQISEGKGLSVHFDQTTLFPPMVGQMISVGEQTGTLANVCTEIAAYYDEEMQARIKVLTTLLEPMIIVFLGGFVGFIAVSVILPMFRLSSALH